ncbi:hypothetical protein AB1Y20_017468 [Prymnesium parvum]|uniref:Uncharacterized protein n=1 Tax=Prymnesium parvum TaxID=97485 RepID=A0AB34JKC4_PRYPA
MALPADSFHRGELRDGWAGFYAEGRAPDRTQLRTYGPTSEKFFETFKLPLAPEPRHKGFAAGPSGSHSWGIGGTYPSGRKHIEPPPARDFVPSSKRSIQCRQSEQYSMVNEIGRKRHVYNEKGEDMRNRHSSGYELDDMLQRKGRVTEEMRTEARTIHRLAPPGLKGYMGPEYSNDFFKHGGSVAPVRMMPTKEDKAIAELKAAADYWATLHQRKTYKQKRAEYELAEQVDLVAGLNLEYEYLDDDEDAPREEEQKERVKQ